MADKALEKEIKKQIAFLEDEIQRAKEILNENNFNCTTAPWMIVKQYRDEMKSHVKILRMNLED